MRTYLIAQETLLSTLWRSKWEGNPKKRKYVEMCICRDDSLCYFVEANKNIFQQKKKENTDLKITQQNNMLSSNDRI